MNTKELAQKGLKDIENAILSELRKVSAGMTNGDLTNILGLQSDQSGIQKNYLCWSILGRLMKEGKVKRISPDGKISKRILYQVVT